jgi:hypothetical protein
MDFETMQPKHQSKVAAMVVNDVLKDPGKYGIELTGKQIEEAAKNPIEFMNEYSKEMKTQLDARTNVIDKYQNRIDDLSDTFGISEQRARELAEAAGVNLYDAFGNMTEMTRDMARQMNITQASMESVWGNFIADVIFNPLQSIEKAAAAPSAMNERARAFREEGLTAETRTVESVVQFLSGMMGDMIDYGGNDWAANEFLRQFGPEGVAFTDPTGPLYGQQDMMDNPMLQRMVDNALQVHTETLERTLQEFSGGNLAAAGFRLSGVSGQDLAGVDQEALRAFLQSPALNITEGASGQMQDAQRQHIENTLRALGLEGAMVGIMGPTAEEKLGTAAQSLADTSAVIKDAMDLVIQELSPGDTKRPIGDVGSTLGSTMNKYNMLNGQLPGTRMITSGYRNYALGSINSDHVMGRALDVVGSNLNGLQSLTQANGGFAEFHGSGSGRHLHMVPNAQGDTAGPVGGGGSTYNYNINVEGGPNAHPQEVARLVMDEIERTSRNRRERA